VIVADENIDQSIIDYLRYNNKTVLSIREELPGISDIKVIDKAASEKALILTEDKDFGELIFSHGLKGCSVLLLRYKAANDHSFLGRILKAIQHYEINTGHYFYTVTPKNVRVRSI
jgi:predicted nuclease of predicted toxin-antitoxin system